MNNKLIYWIPVIGLLVSLLHYEKDNGMPVLWSYYQAFTIIACIWIISLFTF